MTTPDPNFDRNRMLSRNNGEVVSSIGAVILHINKVSSDEEAQNWQGCSCGKYSNVEPIDKGNCYCHITVTIMINDYLSITDVFLIESHK